jgi:hypothetical protein
MSLTEEEIANLPYQFKDKENWRKYFEGTLNVPDYFLTELDKSKFFDLNNATGYTLDIIGDFLNQKRNSLNDEDYRRRLKILTKVNNCLGTANDIIEAFNLLFDYNQLFYTEESNQIKFYINFKTLPTQDDLNLIKILKPAGIYFEINYTLNEYIEYIRLEEADLLLDGDDGLLNDDDWSVVWSLNGKVKIFTQNLYTYDYDEFLLDGSDWGVDTFDKFIIS